MASKSKPKGTTMESLHGKTGHPINGKILELWSKDVPFDHPAIKVVAWRAFVEMPDGTTTTFWWNTYEETLSDGKLTPQYAGAGNDLDRNSTPQDQAKFLSKSTEKGYTKVEDEANYPPQCVLAEAPVEGEDEDALSLVD